MTNTGIYQLHTCKGSINIWQSLHSTGRTIYNLSSKSTEAILVFADVRDLKNEDTWPSMMTSCQKGKEPPHSLISPFGSDIEWPHLKEWWWQIIQNFPEKEECPSDHHINRFESSPICTFLSFPSHWRHPIPLKGEDCWLHIFRPPLTSVEPQTYCRVSPCFEISFLAAIERRILVLIFNSLFLPPLLERRLFWHLRSILRSSHSDT